MLERLDSIIKKKLDIELDMYLEACDSGFETFNFNKERRDCFIYFKGYFDYFYENIVLENFKSDEFYKEYLKLIDSYIVNRLKEREVKQYEIQN